MRAWLSAAACIAGLSATAALGAVNVTVEPPSVARVEFDRREPPNAMPSGGFDGGGLCHSVFELESNIVSAIEMLSPTTVRAYPADFEIVTRLKVTIYVPKDSPTGVREHEEGHRAIAEHYYGNAHSAARDAAVALQRRSFEADGADRAAAERAVADSIRAALMDAYMQKTQARSVAANGRYDVITKHGLDPIAASAAVAGAIAQDP